MYIDEVNFRCIDRFLGIHHQTVVNWVNAYAEKVPDASVPEEVDDVERNELFTYIGSKKENLHNPLRRQGNQVYSWLASKLCP